MWSTWWSAEPEQGWPVSENRTRKSVWLAWIHRNTKQVPRLKCIWIPLNSLRDNQKQLIKLCCHITSTVVKLCWLCWLYLQMYAGVNERGFWPGAFCSLWLGKITRELLEMKARGTPRSLYPSLCQVLQGKQKLRFTGNITKAVDLKKTPIFSL